MLCRRSDSSHLPALPDSKDRVRLGNTSKCTHNLQLWSSLLLLDEDSVANEGMG